MFVGVEGVVRTIMVVDEGEGAGDSSSCSRKLSSTIYIYIHVCVLNEHSYI